MSPDNQRRAETNPLRVLDSKDPADEAIIATLPKIDDFLDDESKAHFAAVLAALDACGVKYEINPRLVRGFDYYSRTTFEFTHGGLGAQNALLGGGRYDGLSEMLSGPKAPGIGFAMGLDRLILTLQSGVERGLERYEQFAIDAYIAPLGEGANAYALELARYLRRQVKLNEDDLRIELGDGTFRLKKSFEMATRWSGGAAQHIVIVGENEMLSGVLTVKNLVSGQQDSVSRDNLANFLREHKRRVSQSQVAQSGRPYSIGQP
jgi:histidyl-tRNA synthetase